MYILYFRRETHLLQFIALYGSKHWSNFVKYVPFKVDPRRPFNPIKFVKLISYFLMLNIFFGFISSRGPRRGKECHRFTWKSPRSNSSTRGICTWWVIYLLIFFQIQYLTTHFIYSPIEENEERSMIEPRSMDDPKLRALITVLVDWINDELAEHRIIVQNVDEDLYDGQVLQKLLGM